MEINLKPTELQLLKTMCTGDGLSTKDDLLKACIPLSYERILEHITILKGLNLLDSLEDEGIKGNIIFQLTATGHTYCKLIFEKELNPLFEHDFEDHEDVSFNRTLHFSAEDRLSICSRYLVRPVVEYPYLYTLLEDLIEKIKCCGQLEFDCFKTLFGILQDSNFTETCFLSAVRTFGQDFYHHQKSYEIHHIDMEDWNSKQKAEYNHLLKLYDTYHSMKAPKRFSAEMQELEQVKKEVSTLWEDLFGEPVSMEISRWETIRVK